MFLCLKKLEEESKGPLSFFLSAGGGAERHAGDAGQRPPRRCGGLSSRRCRRAREQVLSKSSIWCICPKKVSSPQVCGNSNIDQELINQLEIHHVMLQGGCAGREARLLHDELASVQEATLYDV